MTIEGNRIVPGDTATAANRPAAAAAASAPPPPEKPPPAPSWWKALLWRIAIVGGVAAGLALCPLLPSPVDRVCTVVVVEVRDWLVVKVPALPASALPAADAGR